MDNDGLPAIGRGVDLNKIPSIPQKRTVTFINHYLSRSAQLLNEVSAAAERQLERALEQLQQLEAGVCILEGKLDSIPGLTDGITLEPEPEVKATTPQEVVTAQPLSQVQPGTPTEITSSPAGSETVADQISAATDQILNENIQQTVISEEAADRSGPVICQDERFKKYFKMLSVGIATAAVQQKMQMDGLNPDLLLNPNAPAPPPDPDDEASN